MGEPADGGTPGISRPKKCVAPATVDLSVKTLLELQLTSVVMAATGMSAWKPTVAGTIPTLSAPRNSAAHARLLHQTASCGRTLPQITASTLTLALVTPLATDASGTTSTHSIAETTTPTASKPTKCAAPALEAWPLISPARKPTTDMEILLATNATGMTTTHLDAAFTTLTTSLPTTCAALAEVVLEPTSVPTLRAMDATGVVMTAAGT